MHFTRTHTTATWTVGGAGNYVTLVSDWQSLCDKVFKSINGDRGGTWAPTSPVNVAGSGLLVSGPARVDYGGSLKTLSGARFKLGTGNWPKLAAAHVGRLRTIQQDINARQSSPRYWWCDAAEYLGAIQSMGCTVLGPKDASATSAGGVAGIEQPRCAIPLRVHDGSRLTGAKLVLRVPSARAFAPVAMPRLRIVRVDRDGKIEALSSAALGADGEGFLALPAVTSGAAWYAAGAAQHWTIACDQNHTIDTSRYMYFAELIEEVGTDDVGVDVASADGSVVRERKDNVQHVFTSDIDVAGDPGVAGIGSGSEVLVTANTYPWQNGIWVVTTVPFQPWTRRADLRKQSDFTPGFFVVVDGTGSVANAFTAWECVTPLSSQAMQTNTVTPVYGDTSIRFRRRLPRGNVYHSLACYFDSIVDMRPQ